MTAKTEKLSKKERGFVNDYVKTGNGVQSALNNYNTDSYGVAAVIAHENLTKPKIVKAIAERLPDDLLEEKHLALLNKKETVKIRDEFGNEIIQETNQIDSNAVAKGLDMAYKIKGAYGDEKPKGDTKNVYNINLFSKEFQQDIEILENKLKSKLKNVQPIQEN